MIDKGLPSDTSVGENDAPPITTTFENDTPPGAPLKEKYRMERAKLRKLPFKRKVGYIWDYYKIQIIIAAALLLGIGGLINAIFINPRPDTVLFISWNASFLMQEQMDDLRDIMNERIIETGKNEMVEITLILDSEQDPMVSMANIQRLIAMMAAGVIDIFVLDAETLKEYSNDSFLQPLDDILAELRKTSPQVYSRIEENIIYADLGMQDDTFEERKMGIDLSNSRLLTELGMFAFVLDNDVYLGVSSTSHNTDNIVAALILFFE